MKFESACRQSGHKPRRAAALSVVLLALKYATHEEERVTDEGRFEPPTQREDPLIGSRGGDQQTPEEASVHSASNFDGYDAFVPVSNSNRTVPRDESQKQSTLHDGVSEEIEAHLEEEEASELPPVQATAVEEEDAVIFDQESEVDGLDDEEWEDEIDEDEEDSPQEESEVPEHLDPDSKRLESEDSDSQTLELERLYSLVKSASYFEILELENDASAEQIHSAYQRQLDRLAHQLVAARPEFLMMADKIAQGLNEAHQVLTHPELSVAYRINLHRR